MPSSLDQHGLAAPTTAGELADQLLATVCTQMEAFVAGVAPGLELPSVYGGHRVLDDTTADLLYVSGLLVEAGIESIGGVDLLARIPELVASLDPAQVEGFYSYRVGETVLRIGGLAGLPSELHDHVLAAVDTPQTLARVEEGADIPPNYQVVVARCLLAAARLRGDDRDPRLDGWVERVAAMLASQQDGWMNDGMGAWVHYDIYTPDVYLFAEPLAERLGAVWSDGFGKVLDGLADLAQPGGAVVWGRSIGALAMAMTIELAGVASGRGVGSASDRWLARADETLDDLAAWFPGGVVAAHQHRSTMFYRGPHRRLQMTLDLVGKLLLAAADLRRQPMQRAAGPAAAWAPTDRLVVFDEQRNATAWAHRSHGLGFALATMSGFSADYAPSPRGPGLFEQPTSGSVTMLPVRIRSGIDERTGRGEPPLLPAGMPVEVTHAPGRLTVEHVGWGPVGAGPADSPTLDGHRRATYRIEGRSLVVEEELAFVAADGVASSDPITISVAETPNRPLDVSVDGIDHRLHTVDTDGVAEWRSFWGPLPKVHEIELSAREMARFTWRVTPRLRVASTIHGHPYDRALYASLADRLHLTSAGWPDATLARRMRDVDVLHLAWPEWWTGLDPARTQAVIDQVRAAGTRILWTQHNLVPHDDKSPAAVACYQAWAAAADGVIHHSEVGRSTALDTYRYRPECRHVVIPHGHWGAHYADIAPIGRGGVEADESWAPCALRLAVVGAPRAEKQLQLVVDAVAASRRDDIQLVIRVDDEVRVPDDPRIIAERGHLDEHRYRRRMQAFDALILPFAPAGMLTTGTAFDAIGAGIATITSDWDFFDETFAGGDIRYGTTVEQLTACVDALTADDLERARQAMLALQPRFAWEGIAAQTAELAESIATTAPS